jgi:hypothetical protein
MDVALEAWVVRAVPNWTSSRRHALMARIGWIGASPPTLEEVGHREGLTRERARQLQVRLVRKLGAVHAPDKDAFRKAAQLISDHRTFPTKSAGRLLYEHGLVRQPLPDVGIALLFRLLGYPNVFEAYEANLRERQPHLREAVSVAKALTRSVGVGCIQWAHNDSGGLVDLDELKRDLAGASWCRFLDEDWFWDPNTPGGRNRLVNLTEKMLAACGPLEVRELRGGLDRNFRLGRLPHIPSLHALRLFYEAHREFAIDDEDIVTSTRTLSPESELDTVELIIFRILKEAPDGFLDRTEFFRRAVGAGMNPNTFGVLSSYSPIIDNPMQDRWMLRGSNVSPAVLAAKRTVRRRRFAQDEWTARGTLRLRRETPDYWTMVVSVPRALRSYVAERTFDAVDESGAHVGRIRWDQGGTSWGYSGFLESRAARGGDILTAEFDLVTGSVVLELHHREEGEEIEVG